MARPAAKGWSAPAIAVRGVAERSLDERERMLGAADEVLECQRVLKKGGLNVVGELLRGQGTFYELNHYPKGDVFDKATGSQYYYHAHRGMSGENGHLHTFQRRAGIAADLSPVPYDGDVQWPAGDDLVTHLIAISMDRFGYPLGLFLTNRWVTDEAWFAAPDALRILDGFEIDHAYPSWPANRWVTAMLRLFRPEIEALLCQRDAVVKSWAEAHPGMDVFEDRKLEVTGELRISIKKRVAELRAEPSSP